MTMLNSFLLPPKMERNDQCYFEKNGVLLLLIAEIPDNKYP